MGISTAPYRMSGIAGLLFVTLSLIASAVSVQPPANVRDGAVLVDWFTENGARFRLGYVLAALAFLPFYFPFFAGLCEKLREAEAAPAIWSRVAWAGAIMSPVVGVTAGAFNVGPALVQEGLSREVAAFASAAGFYAYPVVSGAMNSIVMLGAAVVILRTGILWRWLGWSGAAIGIAAIAGSAALVENDPGGPLATISVVSWLAYFVWIAAASVALIWERRVPAAP